MNWNSSKLIGVLLSVAVACAGTVLGGDDGSHTAGVLARGKLTMLCFPQQDSTHVRPRLEVLEQRNIPLSELHDADAYEGPDVELIRGFADFLGVDLEIQPITTSYRELIASVATRRGDLAASSLTVTEEREKIVDFSDTTDSVWAVVATRHDAPMLSLEELAGQKIRALPGSSQVDIFHRLGPRDAEIVFGAFTLDNYNAVADAVVDFMLMDSHAEIGEPASEAYPGLKVMIRLTESKYGVAFPEGSDLRERFNDYLARRSDAE